MNTGNHPQQENQSPAEQLPLFAGAVWLHPSADAAAAGVASEAEIRIGTSGKRTPVIGQYKINPHLLAARRLARKMRKLPDHSPEQTRAGLAICEQLKAFLRDGITDPDGATRKPH